jgi:hypothetical protein
VDEALLALERGVQLSCVALAGAQAISGTLKSIFQSWCWVITSTANVVALVMVTSTSTESVVRVSQTRSP